MIRETVKELRVRAASVVLSPLGVRHLDQSKATAGLRVSPVAVTHLFTYPDLGLAIANGFAAEQPGTPGVNVAVLLDPGTTEAAEVQSTAKALAERGLFVRSIIGPAADVTTVSSLIDYFSYDLLMFSTHCGDALGYRWTYEFDDSEGIPRRLVVDIALGIGRPVEDDRLMVTELMYFRSLDGVDWHDPEKKEKLYVGTAIKDFTDRWRGLDRLQPVSKVDIPRVVGSAVLMMCDNNYIPLPQSLAAQGTPIIFNNVCASWRELSDRFLFGGARA